MEMLLPQEIYDEIISHLHDDTPALRAVSTACHAFVAAAQKHLFAHVVLHSPSLRTSKTAPRLRALLERAPHLALYVDFLEVCGRETPAFAFNAREEALMFCLPLMRRLKALRVGYRMDLRRECLLFARGEGGGGGGGRGKSGGTSLAGVLADTLRLPSLACVEFTNLPVALVAHCRNLRAVALQEPDTHDAIVRAWVAARDADAATPLQRRGGAPVALEFLQLDYAGSEIHDSLRGAGFAFGALRRLSVGALDCADADCTAGLNGVLRECAATLEALELDEPRIHSLPPPISIDPIPWGALCALRTLRVNLAFATEDDVGGTAPAGQHLLWLERVLKRMPPALEEVVLQDYTDYWDYFTDDVYVSAWTRIVARLGDRARFPRFRTFVVDSKRSVTEKIRQQVLVPQPQTLPFDVRLGPGQLPGKLGRSFLKTLFGRDWQASDI